MKFQNKSRSGLINNCVRVARAIGFVFSLALISLTSPAQAGNGPGGTQSQTTYQTGGLDQVSTSQWAGQHGINLINQTGAILQNGGGNLGITGQYSQQSGTNQFSTQIQNLNQLGNLNNGAQNQYSQQVGTNNIGVQLQGLTQLGNLNLGIQGQKLNQFGTNNGALQQQNATQGGYYDPSQLQTGIQSGTGNYLQQSQQFLQAH